MMIIVLSFIYPFVQLRAEDNSIYKENDSHQGLFRYVQEGAIIQTFDQDVEAIYTSLRSTLESKERRNDAMPIMLVAGLFTPTDVLTLTKSDHLSPLLQENQTQIKQWSITIPDDGNKTHTLRYLVPEDTKNVQIYLLKDKKWVQVDTKRDGKYILFDIDYNHFVLSVINNPQTALASIFIIPMVLILILVIFIKSIHSKRTDSITQSIS